MKIVSAILVILFALIYLPPLSLRPIMIPDEARYSEIPREMIHSGDWIVPHLDGLRYFEKPVLGYWIIGLSVLVFGENSFAVRLPSALSVGFSAVLIGLLVRRFGGGKKVAFLALAVFITFLEVYGVGTCNVLDSMFSALTTATLVSFYYAYSESRRGPKIAFLIGAGLFGGLAFLVKGFVILAIAFIVIVPFFLWERRWKELFRINWLPILAALLISLPWSIMIALREPDFWPYFFWVEHVERFLTSKHGEHTQRFGYLLGMLLLGAFPWDMFFAAITIGVRRIGLHGSFLRFVICWALFPFLFFSASSGQLGTYILPCYPPIAILVAIGLQAYLESGKMRAFNVGVMLSILMAILGMLFLVLNEMTSLFGLVFFGPNEGWKCLLALFTLAAWGLLLIFALKAADYRKKLAWCVTAPALALILSPLILPHELHEDKMPGSFLLRHEKRVDPNTILVSDINLVHAVCWFYQRNDVSLFITAGELEYGLNYKDAKKRFLDLDDFINLIHKSSGQRRVIVILKAELLATYMRYLRLTKRADLVPRPRFETTENGLWMGEY